jgi:DnaJ-class molecular chaperone
MTSSGDSYVDPVTGHLSCPECGGYGYHENGTDDPEPCKTCDGYGVAPIVLAGEFLARHRVPGREIP